MNWSMPRPVLQLVAVAIGAVAVGAFTLGVVNAPSRGRLPGERADGKGGAAIEAVEATPLSQERIEGPPPPPEPTPEELAKLEAEKLAKAEAEAAARAAAQPVQVPVIPPAAEPAPDRVGDLLQTPPPAARPEDPPF
jgi:hypothetical protein